MKKLVFEGTEDQLNLLKDEFDMLKIEHGTKLPNLREDYQTENLWCVDDAYTKFECDQEEALELLHQALTNDATMEQIWFAIDHYGNEMDLKPIDEEE